MSESLEDKVNSRESKSFARKAIKFGWNALVATASAALSYSLVL